MSKSIETGRSCIACSGILLIITAVLWTIVSRTASILYSSGYPGDPTSYLQLISQHQFLASITWSLWIVSDFLLMAPTIALYIILRPYGRTLALLGSLFAMFFSIYDVCITELNSLTLVSLSHGYADATTTALRGLFRSSGHLWLSCPASADSAQLRHRYIRIPVVVCADVQEHVWPGNCDLWCHCDGYSVNRISRPFIPFFRNLRSLSVYLCSRLRLMVRVCGNTDVPLWTSPPCWLKQIQIHSESTK